MSDELKEGAQDEASPVIGGASIVEKKKWDPKGKRNAFIVGGVVLFACAMMVAMFTGKHEKEAPSYLPENNRVDAKGLIGEEDAAREKNSEIARIQKAKSNGQSAIESTVEGQKIEETTPPKTEAAQAHTNSLPPEERLGQQGQQASPRNDARLNAMTEQIKGQMIAWGMTPEGPQKEDRFYTREYTKTSAAGASTAATKTSNEASSKTDDIVIEAFKTAYSAETISSFDSDAPTATRARILTGPLAGAVLSGTAQRIGDAGAHFSYTQASFQGKTFKVSAEALDEKTASEIVSGNYNGRYSERFVFPIISEGVKAFATAKAQTGTQVVIVSGGGIAQQTPPSTTSQATNAMIAAGADQASRALSSTDQKSQVTVEMNKVIGVRFLESVYGSDLAGTKK